MILPTTRERVPQHTRARPAHLIHEETAERVRYLAAMPEGIAERLAELDREWDVDRLLAVNFGALSLTGLALGKGLDRRLNLLAGVAAAFALQHALQGWSPPLPLLRWLGFRTAAEIEAERYALKALRGEFEGIAQTADPELRAEEALAAVGY